MSVVRRRRRLFASLVVLAALGGAAAAGATAGGALSSRPSTPPRRPASVGVPEPATEPPTMASPTTAPAEAAPPSSPLHRGVTATTFWVGEPGDGDNGHIANSDSTWDERWLEHYGGVDDPRHRRGWLPAVFAPRENPFYVALPYNDLDDNGQVKPSADGIPWSARRTSDHESIVKNTWVRIEYQGRVVYAQWEDAGPFGEDDFASVFGPAAPRSTLNDSAGIDVSPAVQGYLGLDGLNQVDWRFVDRDDIPPGPWLHTVTTSGVSH